MPSVSELLERFKKLDTNRIITASFNDTHKSFEDTQREQLRHGRTSTGELISPRYKRQKYAIAKNAINPLPGLGVPDLKFHGDFYREINMEADANVLDIISKDEKGPMLENKYKNIFGLNQDYRKNYINSSLHPVIKNKIEGATGLKFG